MGAELAEHRDLQVSTLRSGHETRDRGRSCPAAYDPARGDDVLAAAARPPGRRSRAHPRRRLRPDLEPGDGRRPRRADRARRRGLDRARALPLRDPRGPAGRGPAPFLCARRRGAHRPAHGRRGVVGAAAGGHDRALPAAPGRLEREWVLWVELWLRAVRHPPLQDVSHELYARLHEWFAGVIAEGRERGEFAVADIDAATDVLLGAIDGIGVRVLAGDPALPLDRARTLMFSLASRELGAEVG